MLFDVAKSIHLATSTDLAGKHNIIEQNTMYFYKVVVQQYCIQYSVAKGSYFFASTGSGNRPSYWIN